MVWCTHEEFQPDEKWEVLDLNIRSTNIRHIQSRSNLVIFSELESWERRFYMKTSYHRCMEKKNILHIRKRVLERVSICWTDYVSSMNPDNVSKICIQVGCFKLTADPAAFRWACSSWKAPLETNNGNERQGRWCTTSCTSSDFSSISILFNEW